MQSTYALVFLLLAASAARADVARFPLWYPYGPATSISRDGYHIVQLTKDKRRVLLDGKEVYTTSSPNHDKINPMMAISKDGSSWVMTRGEANEAGAYLGMIMTVNGHEMRRDYSSVRELKFSPKGGNLAYIAHGADGKYSVISAQGAGPAFETSPGLISVGDNGVLYNADWQGRRWLYRDHNPGKGPDYQLLESTPDLAHVLATYKLGREFGASMDGAEFGRWPEIGYPMIDDKGRAAFFISSTPDAKGWYDRLYVDGKTTTIPLSKPDSPVFNSAGAFWHVGDAVYRDAEKIGSWSVYGNNWVGASPSGRHWAFLAGNRQTATLIIDGLELDAGMPPPLFNTPPVFDGENTLHYLGVDNTDKAVMVCVTLDESRAARSACAKKAAAMKPPSGSAD
jgi:hypothetical protein